MTTPTVVACLANYLSLRDLFTLSAVDCFFYKVWSQNQRVIDATNLRNRVEQRLHRSYKKRNPLLMVRKEVGKGFKDNTFRCFGQCARKMHIKWMMNRKVYPLPRCSTCANKTVYTFRKVEDYVAASFFEYPKLHWNLCRVYFKPNQNTEVLVP